MKKIILLMTAICLITAACLAAGLGESVPIDDTLRFGDTGEAVSQLQQRLRALYYYSGPVSGEYGSLTQSAVAAVQTAYGMDATGVADTETLDLIYGECYRPLKYNDQGEDVKALQEKLAELGYYTGPITGNYLDKTRAAVKQMQAEFGMEDTGAADVFTQEAVFAADARPAATPIPVGVPDMTVKYNGELKYGSTGERVRLVQQRLKDLGFFTYYKTTTGYYKNTQQAVKDFQKYNGLIVTGTVNEKTWNCLFYDETVVAADGVPKPTATPEPVPYSVEVDVNNQVVKIWKYNEETGAYDIMDRAFLCSTGTKSNPSELGQYVLTGRRARWCEFPKWGGGKAQYWVRINSDIAFHSVLYGANDEMSLKVSSLNNLGKRGSHGCIRLTVADAKWVYDNCRAGTVVTIHEDGIADPELRAAIQPGALDKSVMLPKTTPAPTPAPAYDGTRVPEGEITPLKKGSSGESVYWLQSKLKEWGYYTGTVTGTYLDGTSKAVMAFQKENGIRADGTASKYTLEKIYERVIEENSTPEPTLVPTPIPTVTPEPAATAEPVPGPTATAEPVPSPTATPVP